MLLPVRRLRRGGAGAARGERSRFKDLFADWATALYLDGPGDAGLERVDLRNVARAAIDLPASNVSRNARLWGTDYLDLSGSFDGLTVSLGSNGDNPVLAVLIDAVAEVLAVFQQKFLNPFYV